MAGHTHKQATQILGNMTIAAGNDLSDPTASAGSSGQGALEGMKMMMMQMYFTTSTHVTLWLKEWRTDSPIWYLVSLLGLLGLAILQEVLSSYRAAYYRRLTRGLPEIEVPFTTSGGSSMGTAAKARMFLTALYALNVAISYLLMLAVMTYNVGYFVIIVLGLAAGHFLFFTETSASAPADTCCPQPQP